MNKHSNQQMLKQHDQQTSKKPSGQTKTDSHSFQQALKQPDQQSNKNPSGKTNNKFSQKTNKQSSPQTNNQSSQQENHQSNKQTGNRRQQVRKQCRAPQWKQILEYITRTSLLYIPILAAKSVQMQVSPVGLKNFGNTCILNAVIQCLAVADDRDWEAVARKAFGEGQLYGKIICEQLWIWREAVRSYLIP